MHARRRRHPHLQARGATGDKKGEDEEGKLRNATKNALRRAEEKGVKRLAIPPIGTGLYQVPMDLCVRVMVDTVQEHLNNVTTLEEVLFVTMDEREFGPFKKAIEGGA